MAIPYNIHSDRLNTIVKGRPFVIYQSDSRYETALTLIKEGDVKGLEDLLDPATNINNKYNNQGLSIVDGVVTYINKEGQQEALPTALIKSLVAMFKQDEASVQPLILFWEKLKLNPSYRVNNCLFDFISHNNIVINEKGNLIMYKIVKRTSDPNVFVDLYTGKFKNELGKPVQVERRLVDDDIEKTCSYGLNCVASY